MKNSADLGGCYPPRPSASVDNTLLDLQNSSYPTRPHSIIPNYYSFKIFPHFWLVKTTCIIHHKQPLDQEFCHIEPMTSKVQPAADYWTIDVKDYWTIGRENLGSRLCHSTKREMVASRVYEFERRKYFEWIIKQLLNSTFVGREEFCGSRRVLSHSPRPAEFFISYSASFNNC